MIPNDPQKAPKEGPRLPFKSPEKIRKLLQKPGELSDPKMGFHFSAQSFGIQKSPFCPSFFAYNQMDAEDGLQSTETQGRTSSFCFKGFFP